MDAHNLLEEWERSPFSGGYGGLRDLQSRGASGAVAADGAVLFLRDGEPVAVVEDLEGEPRPGDLEALERADGHLHEADHPQAATLGAMLALDGEVRGRYFTDDTPLSAVRETLSEGGFTGYVELADNVLSGDYYVVYRDGDEEFVAFVGPSSQVLVGDEARSRAADEVGIYSVVAVEPPDLELPAAGPTGDGATASTDPVTGGGSTADTGGSEGTEAAEGPAVVGSDGAGGGDGSTGDGPTAVGDRVPPEDTSVGAAPADATTDPALEDGRPAEDGTPVGHVDDRTTTGGETADGDAVGPGDDVESGAEAGTVDESGSPDDRTNGGTTVDGSTAGGSSAFDVGPVRSPGDGDAETSGNGNVEAAGGGDTDRVGTGQDRTDDDRTDDDQRDDDQRADVTSGATATDAPGGDVVPVTDDADDRPVGVDDSADDPDGLETLRAEVQALREERDALRRRVDALESDGSVSEGGAMAGGTGGGADGGRVVDPGEALEGTSLFVRTESRGGATLEAARDGEIGREELAQNVRIEHHTTFDDGAATVEGRAFEEWLRATPQYRFLRWVVVQLPFEIRETGSTAAMQPLYDALPSVDRVGLDDAIAVGDGQERREVSFDVVARDQMGDPLFVATIDEGRDPTAGDALAQLVTDVTEVSAANDSLAATFAVTSSYFEPAALQAVREATSGSLLGRERRASYVKLSRRNGFHVCLVERRADAFHLTVPEL